MFLKLFVITVAIWQVSALRGGTNANVGRFPSFVAIFVPTQIQICGGAVINSNHVLTLSSCLLTTTFTLLTPNSVSVMSGHNQIDFNRARIGGQAIYVHPQYNPFTQENDVAVLRIASPFNFQEIATPPLAPGVISDRIAHDTLSCTVAAWNRTSNQQQFLNVPIYNRDLCNNLPLNFGRVRDSMICAGIIAAGTGVCEENVGAVLFCNGMVEGILNSGYGCGAANNPGIYVSARHHSAWIQEQLRRQDIPAGGSSPLERLP